MSAVTQEIFLDIVSTLGSKINNMGHLSTSERIDAAKVMNSSDDKSKVAKIMFSENDEKSENENKTIDHNNNNDNADDNDDIKNDKIDNTKDIIDIDNHQNNNINNNNINCNGSIKYSCKSELNVNTIPATTTTTSAAAPKKIRIQDLPNFDGPKVLGYKFEAPLKWDKIFMIGIFHMIFLYGALSYSLINNRFYTTLWALFMGGAAGFGVTGGVHRLWSHKSYKAKVPLRIILMICYSIAGQNTIYDWVRDHRVHHKFSETDADPHNSNRGFFFAHVGWLMMHKHPNVLKRGRQIDMSDILSDPVIQFHQKFFIPMKIIFCFLLPTLVPVYGWNESWYWSIMTQVVLRYVFSLNFTWSVNSAAHMWGNRPYDKKINPSQNIGVSIVAMGEGWHNYHHVFPWDYKAAELGNYGFNITTFWIDLFAKIGWAYDLKQPSKELVRRTIEKCGDGTHPVFGHHATEVPPPDAVEPEINNCTSDIIIDETKKYC